MKKLPAIILLLLTAFAPAALSATPDTARAHPSPRPMPKPAAKKTPAKKAPEPIRYVNSAGRRYVNLQDVAKFYGLTFRLTRKGTLLHSAAHRIELTTGKRAGAIDQTAVTFFFPMLEQNGTYYLSELDFLKVIDPALRKKLPRHRLRRIVIDPGHGGKDPGAKGPVLDEKQIALQIALRLRKKLAAYGFDVLMTRSSDTFPSLEDRAEFCRKHRPDLFISIHCNASTSRSATGIETWYLVPKGAPSAQGNTPKASADSGNRFDRYNFRLAYEIQKALRREFPDRLDRGVKPSRFYVLRHSSSPAILIETGFLSNYTEGRALATKNIQERTVNAIVNGLAGYINAIR